MATVTLNEADADTLLAKGRLKHVWVSFDHGAVKCTCSDTLSAINVSITRLTPEKRYSHIYTVVQTVQIQSPNNLFRSHILVLAVLTEAKDFN